MPGRAAPRPTPRAVRPPRAAGADSGRRGIRRWDPEGHGAAGQGWALRRTNVQEDFGGEPNPHQEGLRVTYSGDEAVELRVVRGHVVLLAAAAADGGRDGPPRWATGDLLLEDGTRLRFEIRDDATGGQLGMARTVGTPGARRLP